MSSDTVKGCLNQTSNYCENKDKMYIFFYKVIMNDISRRTICVIDFFHYFIQIMSYDVQVASLHIFLFFINIAFIISYSTIKNIILSFKSEFLSTVSLFKDKFASKHKAHFTHVACKTSNCPSSLQGANILF